MSRCRRRLLQTIVAALCCVALHGSAAAQPGNVDEMNRLNEEGFVEFRAGRYEAAADLFRAAYDTLPDPGLQKNEAIAWFKAGRCDRAMPVANAFLISQPPAAEGLEARSILANCRVEMARAAIDAGNYPIAETLLSDAESLQPDSYAVDQIAIARVQLAQARAQPSEPTPRSHNAPARTVGWVLVGVGASLAVGSLTYWLLTSDARDRPQWLVPVGIASGAAVAGLGVFLVVTNRANRATPVAGLTYRW